MYMCVCVCVCACVCMYICVYLLNRWHQERGLQSKPFSVSCKCFQLLQCNMYVHTCYIFSNKMF